MATIVKDTDTTIELTVTDVNGAAIDLTTLSGYVVEIRQKTISFDKFSKNAQAGFRTVNETDAANGKFEIYLNAANTNTGVLGKEVFFEIKTLIANANFDSSTEEKSSGLILLGTLERSDMKRQTFA